MKVNGQPADGATVIFYREGSTGQDFPVGKVESDGSFTLITGGKPGAPAGKYTVTVVWPEPKKLSRDAMIMGADPNDGPDRLKGAYGTPQNSTIKAEIKSGKNELEPFELK